MIELYNTLSRKKEEFVPLEEGKVRTQPEMPPSRR